MKLLATREVDGTLAVIPVFRTVPGSMTIIIRLALRLVSIGAIRVRWIRTVRGLEIDGGVRMQYGRTEDGMAGLLW